MMRSFAAEFAEIADQIKAGKPTELCGLSELCGSFGFLVGLFQRFEDDVPAFAVRERPASQGDRQGDLQRRHVPVLTRAPAFHQHTKWLQQVVRRVVVAMIVLDAREDGKLASGPKMDLKKADAVDDVIVDALGVAVQTDPGTTASYPRGYCADCWCRKSTEPRSREAPETTHATRIAVSERVRVVGNRTWLLSWTRQAQPQPQNNMQDPGPVTQI